MKLYIAKATCSRAPQVVINELGLDVELVLFDIPAQTTSNGERFADVNRYLYVPVLELDDAERTRISEAPVITVHLAEIRPDAGLVPAAGTLGRLKTDEALAFIATEIAQKHIPLMRQHLNEAGARWARARLVDAYARFDDWLADGRPWLAGESFGVVDIYLWATQWQDRTGVSIDHLPHLAGWRERMEDRPSVIRALADEAALIQAHAEGRAMSHADGVA